MLDDIFFSTSAVGYIGPLILVVGVYFLAKRDVVLGVVGFLVQALFVEYYASQMISTPGYIWHIVIIIFGSLSTWIGMFLDR